MLTNIVNGILQNIPFLISGAVQVVGHLAGAITSALPTILQKGKESVSYTHLDVYKRQSINSSEKDRSNLEKKRGESLSMQPEERLK